MTLRVKAAKTPAEAAKVYPGDYWLSMLEIPATKEFPGTGNAPQGNGIGAGMTTQANYVHALKSNCNFCHQLGQRHHARPRSRVQGQAGAQDARRGVGMAAGRRRPRQQHVRRAGPAGTGAHVESLGRLVARHRERRGAARAAASTAASSATWC